MERSSNRTPEAYKHLDRASAAVLLFMTVWAPWAFGCTVDWAQRVLCGGGYVAGALLIGKWVVRHTQEYKPSRWAEPTPVGRRMIQALAAINVFFLLYVMIGALNARAVGEYVPVGADQGVNLRYLDRTPIPWLPASYDAPVSWAAFWRWTGLAWAFWAARDWLLGKTRSERRDSEDDDVIYPGDRVRTWLWTISASSFVLSAVSVIQRLDGTNKLLWLLAPRHPDPNSIWSYPINFHFGSFNYRGNAAEYFNLVWPLVLGLWKLTSEVARRRRGVDLRIGQGPHVLLLPWAIVIAAAPIISGSRGGVLVTAVLGIAVGFILSVSPSRWSITRRLATFGSVVLLLIAAVLVGGSTFIDRIKNPGADPYSNRLVIYEEAKAMMADFAWLGSGADTFASIQPFYRKTPWEVWTGYAHNDWMESVITLGAVGTLMLVSMLVLALVLPLAQLRYGGGKTSIGIYFYLAIGGLLIHALFDFPLQVASLQFEFLMVLAVFSTLVQKDSAKS